MGFSFLFGRFFLFWYRKCCPNYFFLAPSLQWTFFSALFFEQKTSGEHVVWSTEVKEYVSVSILFNSVVPVYSLSHHKSARLPCTLISFKLKQPADECRKKNCFVIMCGRYQIGTKSKTVSWWWFLTRCSPPQYKVFWCVVAQFSFGVWCNHTIHEPKWNMTWPENALN